MFRTCTPYVLACAALASSASVLAQAPAPAPAASGNAAAPAVDPAADKVFRAMTTYIAGLKSFSLRTQSAIDVVTKDGQRLQFNAPATIDVERPNRFFAQREGDIISQAFYFDGKSLTLFNPDTKYYATVAAPATIDGALDMARDKLDIIAPGTDILDTRAYSRMMSGVTSAIYLGIEMIGAQQCHHLAYRAGNVDWQLWVRVGDKPAPCKYVITSNDVVGTPQFQVEVMEWNSAPRFAANHFNFTAPAGAKKIDFLPSAAP